MHGAGKFRSDWNLALIEDVIARNYADLLSTVTQKIDPRSPEARAAYYQLFPQTGKLVRPWACIIPPLLRALYDAPTVVCNGKWAVPNAGVVFVAEESDALPLSEFLSHAGLNICVCPGSIPTVRPYPPHRYSIVLMTLIVMPCALYNGIGSIARVSTLPLSGSRSKLPPIYMFLFNADVHNSDDIVGL